MACCINIYMLVLYTILQLQTLDLQIELSGITDLVWIAAVAFSLNNLFALVHVHSVHNNAPLIYSITL